MFLVDCDGSILAWTGRPVTTTTLDESDAGLFLSCLTKGTRSRTKKWHCLRVPNLDGFLLAEGNNGPTTTTCWDLEAETEVAEIPTRVGAEACVTTLTTAWEYELVSGTTEGTIQAWDLRMVSSLWTIEAQRSVMTTMAVHAQVPMIATGSGAQCIKLLTPEGETAPAIRNHKVGGSSSHHRIGPVSCLAFHKYKPLMAAGATDSFIGLYKLAGF